MTNRNVRKIVLSFAIALHSAFRKFVSITNEPNRTKNVSEFIEEWNCLKNKKTKLFIS